MRFSPVYSLWNAMGLLMTGKLQFPRARVGEQVQFDGEVFRIFRHAVVDTGVMPQAVFIVRFKIANMTPEQNVRFSMIPIPFFIGLPGFCSKLWLLNPASGEFCGLYHWKGLEDAEQYANSFAVRFMTSRAVPSSLSSRIVPANEVDV